MNRGEIAPSQPSFPLPHSLMSAESVSFKDEFWRYSIAGGSVLASIGIVALTIAAGWYLMWVTTLRKMKLVRELRGLNRVVGLAQRTRQISKHVFDRKGISRRLDERERKELDEEIERVKMQHRRVPSRRASPSMSTTSTTQQ